MTRQLEEKKAKTALSQAMEDSAVSGSPGRRRSLHVLLVDDNRDHMLLVRRELEHRGHHVTGALSGEEAMGALAGGVFDAMVLDYQLPDATGLQLLQQIRAQTEGLPIIMITASGNEQVAVSALKSGASDYVVKEPGYERELPRAVEQAAEAARASAAEAVLQAELERRAKTDPLTGLLNRGEMERLLKREIQRTARYHCPLSFALIDVDGFKSINDTRGHPTGDAVLCRIAGILQSALRASDSTARWGGDEFAVLLPDTGFDGARAFAERLRLDAKASLQESSKEEIPTTTLSVGFVLTRGEHDHDLDLPALLKWADRALYAAKEGGRDRANFFDLDKGEEVCGEAKQVSSPEAAKERMSDD